MSQKFSGMISDMLIELDEKFEDLTKGGPESTTYPKVEKEIMNWLTTEEHVPEDEIPFRLQVKQHLGEMWNNMVMKSMASVTKKYAMDFAVFLDAANTLGHILGEYPEGKEESRGRFMDWVYDKGYKPGSDTAMEMSDYFDKVWEAVQHEEEESMKVAAALQAPRWLPEDDKPLWDRAVNTIEARVGEGNATYPAVVAVYKTYKKRPTPEQMHLPGMAAALELPPYEGINLKLWELARGIAHTASKEPCYPCIVKCYEQLVKDAHDAADIQPGNWVEYVKHPGPGLRGKVKQGDIGRVDDVTDEGMLIVSFIGAEGFTVDKGDVMLVKKPNPGY